MIELQREKGLVTTMAGEAECAPQTAFLKMGRDIKLFSALAETSCTLQANLYQHLFSSIQITIAKESVFWGEEEELVFLKFPARVADGS